MYLRRMNEFDAKPVPGTDLVKTVSGDIRLTDVTSDRLGAQSISGDVEYAGTLGRSGRYDITSHSGSVRVTLSGATGFELRSTTFSGSIRSDIEGRVTTGGGGDRGTARGRSRVARRGGPGDSIQATVGDGSASLNVRTFSGDIVITKR